MDNASPSPPKRPRNIDIMTAQLEKSVRFFPFGRKLPGILQHGKGRRRERVPSIKGQNVVSSSVSVLPFSSTMKFVPNKEANISSKLQKLKLKSPDGRDLGEINVQLLPQKGDGIGGKTIMLQKHSLFGKIENPTAVSILKPVDKTKQTAANPIIALQTQAALPTVAIGGSNCVSISTGQTINTVKETSSIKRLLNFKQKIDGQQSSVVLRHSDKPKCSTTQMGSKVFFINVDKQTGLNTVYNDNRNTDQSPCNAKVVTVHAENYPDSTEDKTNGNLSTAVDLHTTVSSKDESSTESASSTSNARNSPKFFWNPSKFSEITAKASSQKSRMAVNGSLGSVSNMINEKGMTIVTLPADSEHINGASKESAPVVSNFRKKQNSKLNSWTIVKTYAVKRLANGRKSSCESDGKFTPKHSMEISRVSEAKDAAVTNTNSENSQSVTSTTNSVLHQVNNKQADENVIAKTRRVNTAEKSSSDPKLRENIMVILHGDMNTLHNNEKNCSAEKEKSKNETNSMEVDARIETNANVSRDGKAVEIIAAASKRDFNLAPATVSTEQNLMSSTLNTVSAKQQDLDIIQKALSSCKDQDLREKALKALADCGIGVKRDVPVSPMVSVSDSQTQTTVFGLLKPKMFVECNESSPTFDTLEVVDWNEKSSLHLHDSRLQNPQELHPISNQCFDIPMDPLFEIDFSTELEHLLPNDTKKEVNQIKHIFSKPDPIVSIAFTQMQKDFHAATTIDDHGMMGIHRAVLTGEIREVQRQLIVLKAVKESIDVPTSDGKTSLELAVLNDINPHIIKVLLMAGAKPAFPTKVYESALIIASRLSSSVLHELINHVTPSTLLDNIDAEGFAPLHYCAQLGNTQGVKVLVSAGANVNLRDAKSGRTPLFHALENRNIEIAWYLMENGASPDITNFAGQLPAALVDEYRHTLLAEKLNQSVR